MINRERYTEDPALTSGEAIVGTNVQVFLYGAHDTDIDTDFRVLPSVSDLGRLRLSLNTRVRFELLGDLYLGLNLFEQYDSNPPQEGAKKNDFGVSSSIGYSWGLR